jgi:hypothetical protein
MEKVFGQNRQSSAIKSALRATRRIVFCATFRRLEWDIDVFVVIFLLLAASEHPPRWGKKKEEKKLVLPNG